MRQRPMTDLTGDAIPDDEPGFPGLAPAPETGSLGQSPAYRVLARKYRPSSFADLIGQDAMVRTVSNAFTTNRIPQAWMLTGVRGVGKTTTARILARALNYDTGAPGAGPSVAMPDLGIHCRSIMESRHVDVMEMDAASHTGVENIRQITDAVRYAPVQARYKVYIIDEVHMLSSAAFNAFLKTLEEPPPHAKFVFATTEIRKVPVTILSRCQRFDLRRVETGTLARHLGRICAAEDVAAEPEALAAIARAAEGSVRDSLSLLDQAMAHGAGTVTASAIREMLGLADRRQVVDLFEAAMRGDVPACFAGLRAGWEAGADPGQTLSDLAAFTHLVTRIKLVPDAARDPVLTEDERVRGADFAARLSVGTLSRAWQILLKAAPEVTASSQPLATAEMALVRLAYAADLPSPEDALRRLRAGAPLPVAEPLRLTESVRPHPEALDRRSSLEGGLQRSLDAPSRPALQAPQDEVAEYRREQPTFARQGGGSAALARPVEVARQPEPEPSRPPAKPEPQRLARFEDVVALAGERRDIALKRALEHDVRPVRFEDGRLEIDMVEGAARSLPNELSRALGQWTGRPWVVVLSAETGGPTIAELKRARESERRGDAASHPLVMAVMDAFPGAEIVRVEDRAPPEPEPVPLAAPDSDEPLDEPDPET